MDLILFIMVLPELLLILLGFIIVFSSLAGNGDLQRLIPHFRPRGKRVPSDYWGYYKKAEPPLKVEPIATFSLPKLIKERQPDHLGPDWNG